MSDRLYHILFVCTGNSARSILAEALMNHLAGGRFRAYSAGSAPKGEVHPLTLQALAQLGLPTAGYRSKSWEEFAAPNSPPMDFVFTVCDQAAGEVCPVWPGQPVTAHWGMADPAAVQGTDEVKRKAFLEAGHVLKRRIELMLALPHERLDRLALHSAVRNIGQA